MSRKASRIRVGIIRCDTHAYWYAPYFEKPDPKLYRKAHRGCHYYHYRWDDPDRMRLSTVPSMTIAKVYDEEDPRKAEGLSEAYRGRPKVCDSYEEVSDDVDLIYIADCSYEGKDHLRFATPGLKKGVPHFVDKPFAFTLKDARKMIDLAKKHRTAVMCSSLLRQSPFLRRFPGSFQGCRARRVPTCVFRRAGAEHPVSRRERGAEHHGRGMRMGREHGICHIRCSPPPLSRPGGRHRGDYDELPR